MNDSADVSWGSVDWELTDRTTGQVRSGQRELRDTDFEVIVYPPPTTPQLRLIRTRPRQVMADAVNWALMGGRGVTIKRFRLADGFWLVHRERPGRHPPSFVHLSADNDERHLSYVGVFRVQTGGASAQQAQGTGSLDLGWGQDRHRFYELVDLTVAGEGPVSLHPPSGPGDREPVALVRIMPGSWIRWPRSADGVRLVPHLRPDLSRPPPDF